jgi:hypothetical protein
VQAVKSGATQSSKTASLIDYAPIIHRIGETVTYKFKKDNYYVISGVNPNGYEFYHKVFFYPTYWLEFEITYPHAQHAVYDAWVERIARDFVPALPDNGQYDR